MSVVDGGSSSGLVQRVQDILLRPKPTWDVIDAEPATVKGLYTGYILILAAIPVIAGWIGGLVFGTGFALFSLVGAIFSYILNVAAVYVVSLIVDALAPSFGGTKNPIQALKVIAYASTAAWVAGILSIIPFVGGLLAALLSLYSIYLLYLGLPRLMKTTEDKAIPYTLVVIVLWIVLAIIIGSIVGLIAAMGLAGGAIGAAAFN
jgi:hypothetical protein